MACVNSFKQRCDRVLRLHVRQVNRVTFDIYQQLQRAERIYGKYGIFVTLASIQSASMSLRDVSRLSSVESECIAGENSDKQDELYARFGVQDLSSITVFLVQSLPIPATPPAPAGTRARRLRCARTAPTRRLSGRLRGHPCARP